MRVPPEPISLVKHVALKFGFADWVDDYDLLLCRVREDAFDSSAELAARFG